MVPASSRTGDPHERDRARLDRAEPAVDAAAVGLGAARAARGIPLDRAEDVDGAEPDDLLDEADVVVVTPVVVEVVEDEVGAQRPAHEPAEALGREPGRAYTGALGGEVDAAADLVEAVRREGVAPRVPLGEPDFLQVLAHARAVVVEADLVHPDLGQGVAERALAQ